jgi:hypothetical protein
MKQIVLCTNCQGDAISHIIRKYYSHLYCVSSYINFYHFENKIPIPRDAFAIADIFIYQNYNSKKHDPEYDIDNILNNVLKPECIKVCIPFLFFEAMFSYNMDHPHNKSKIKEFYYGIDFIDDKIKTLDLTLFTEDDKTNLIESIYSDFISDDAIPESQIKFYYDKSFGFLEHKIMNSDVPNLMEFIKDNFTKTRLWNNRNHPTGKLLIELVKSTLALLNLEYKEDDEDILHLHKQFDDWSMPLLPCVKKYYGMKFDDYCSSYMDASIVDNKTFICKYVNEIFF